MSGEPAPLLEIRGLAVAAGGRRLLEPTDLALAAGERALLVGPSGGGKTLLLDLMLGFAGPDSPGLDVQGSIRLDGRELLGAEPGDRDHRVGAVFQLNAPGLFDELTIEQNLRFGSPDPERRRAVASRLRLEHLERRVTDCSGGEQVRVGLARTLLRGSRVLLCDEPTTGLDPGATADVVAAIGAAHDGLTIVSTHDVDAFAQMADVILFLDPVERRIHRRRADAESRAAVREALRAARPVAAEAVGGARPALPRRLAAAWSRLAAGAFQLASDLGSLVALPAAYARIAHPIDGPRLRRLLARDLSLGVGAFVAVSAMLVAFTATWFLFERFPERAYAEPLFQEDLVAGLGIVSTRVVVPLLTSILLAAKLGASAAAHLGHMTRTRQVDALRLLRVSPRRHLLHPTAGAQLLSALAACALALVLSASVSLCVFLATHPGWSVPWFWRAWGQELEAGHYLWIAGKVGLGALVVAVVAYRTAVRPKRTPEEVIRGIHRTLLRGLLLVVLVHAAFAFLEF